MNRFHKMETPASGAESTESVNAISTDDCRVGFRSSIAYRSAVRAVLIAFGIGLLLNCAQVAVDLAKECENLKRRTWQAMRILGEPARQALFTVDRPLAQYVVDGIFKTPGVIHAAVIDDYDEIYASRTVMLQRTIPRRLLHFVTDEQFELILPLESHGQSIGRILVRVDVHQGLLDFYDRTLFIFLGGMVRNFILALALFLLYQVTLVKPLRRISGALLAIDPGKVPRSV